MLSQWRERNRVCKGLRQPEWGRKGAIRQKKQEGKKANQFPVYTDRVENKSLTSPNAKGQRVRKPKEKTP